MEEEQRVRAGMSESKSKIKIELKGLRVFFSILFASYFM